MAEEAFCMAVILNRGIHHRMLNPEHPNITRNRYTSMVRDVGTVQNAMLSYVHTSKKSIFVKTEITYDRPFRYSSF